jgi:hypothetical protein
MKGKMQRAKRVSAIKTSKIRKDFFLLFDLEPGMGYPICIIAWVFYGI